MQWSKLKSRVESHFAPSVAGRVEVGKTSYRDASSMLQRGWITVDKQEVQSFCAHDCWTERAKLIDGIVEANALTSRSGAGAQLLAEATAQAAEILAKRRIVREFWFVETLKAFLDVPLDGALTSGNYLHRALALLDKRLGHR